MTVIFRIIIPLDDSYSFDSDTEKGTEKGTEKVSPNQQLIMDSIINNPQITIDELSVTIGIAASKVKENLSKLKAKGLIERVGADKGGYWSLLNAKKR